MNKSYSKIRHIQETNLKLEQRRFNQLFESKTVDRNMISSCGDKISFCFDKRKFPNLYKAASGSISTVMGLLLMWAGAASEVLSFGVSTLVMVAGADETTDGIKKIYDANISKIDNELSLLYDCVFGGYDGEGCSG
jgi:hypothetical protein